VSRIETLIEELCPEGVPFVEISVLVRNGTPKTDSLRRESRFRIGLLHGGDSTNPSNTFVSAVVGDCQEPIRSHPRHGELR
jgi:hypothetical protein